MNDNLSKPTAIFGIRMWVVVGACVGASFVLILFLISLWLAARRSRNRVSSSFSDRTTPIPVVSKDIVEVGPVETGPGPEPDPGGPERRIRIEIGKDHRICYPAEIRCGHDHDDRAAAQEPRDHHDHDQTVPAVSHLGWGRWYTLRELEAATGGFAPENVVGEGFGGDGGMVYHGVLESGAHVLMKNLLNNRGQAEKEFKVEVETIGRIRHKNLVRLLGYCAEGAHRILVYEYVNNGSLDQWLHGDVGPSSPLTWEIRMNIILGIAKGLTYLHEGLEPKVVHRNLKSSSILLDNHWIPKVSDFGLAKLIDSEMSYTTTRVLGTFGYVAPEYASTGMLNERSDVYSFGVLMMEIISGRKPVDNNCPSEEAKLVEWLKKMVSNRNSEAVLDPKLPYRPATKTLKRALLVALRCVDSTAQKRPKMGHVVHMLEANEAPLKNLEEIQRAKLGIATQKLVNRKKKRMENQTKI